LLKNEEKTEERKLISPLDLAGYEGKSRASLNIYGSDRIENRDENPESIAPLILCALAESIGDSMDGFLVSGEAIANL